MKIEDETSKFEDGLFFRLFNTWEVKELGEKNINTGKLMNGAPMTWIPLLRFSVSGPSLNVKKQLCLVFRIPYLSQHNHGILQLFPADGDGQCRNFETTPTEQLTGIEELIVGLKQEELRLKIKIKGKMSKINIPLYNLEKEFEYQMERYASSVKRRKIPGLYISSFGTTRRQEPVILKNDLSNDAQVICHKVNDKCKTIEEFRCNLCRYGWFETASNKCPQGGSKFCRPSKCGEKNRPACLRGYEMTSGHGCYDNSVAGFCGNGLHTVCGPDGFLICSGSFVDPEF